MLKNKIRIDFNKNTKFTYYLVNVLQLLIPNVFYRNSLDKIINNPLDLEYIQKRVDYYNKLEYCFDLDKDTVSIQKFIKDEQKKTYYFDLLKYFRYFNKNFKVSYLFGDITEIPKVPSFLKSRPIEGENQNSILMKLNKIRHFVFVNDTLKFEDKHDTLVWRGKCNIAHRQKFIQAFYDKPYCNVGQTNTKNTDVPWQKSKMQLKEQLHYKFILTIEGNDVATNLKWVMSSNSLAFMCKPTYETWFMEGKLIPNHHYVLLKEDYSDLKDKIEYYSTHIDEAKIIIQNAHKHVEQFKNKKRESIISLLVLKKYFEKSKQL